MKKLATHVFSLVFLTTLLLVPCSAGNLNISGRAGVYTPIQSGASPSMMYGLGIEYEINDYLSARLAGETTTYKVDDVQYAFTPVTLDLIYRQPIGPLVPYAGAGLGYYAQTVAGETTETMGAQAEAGFRFALGGLDAGVEFRYMIPDTSDMSTGSSSYNGYATGTFTQTITL